jgi:hypothetical protein
VRATQEQVEIIEMYISDVPQAYRIFHRAAAAATGQVFFISSRNSCLQGVQHFRTQRIFQSLSWICR